MRKLAFLFLTAFLLAASCTRVEKSATIGMPAPNFTLQDLEGRKIALRELKGKVVLLEFWATWCAPCRDSLPAIEKIYTAYQGKGLAVLGVSLDSGDWDSVKAFVKEFGITFPVLKGDDDVSQRYMVRTIPLSIILDREGTIRHRFLGGGNEEEIGKEIKALLGG